MGRGRRPAGAELADRLDGSDEAKQRLRVILETLAGQRTVTAACELLGIGGRQFHELRARVLQAGLNSLEPRPSGRPVRRPTAREIAELEAELQQLRIELHAAQLREEIATALPHLRARRPPEKGGKSKQRSSRPSNDTKPST